MTSLLQKLNTLDIKVDGLDSSNLQTQITTNSNDISALQTNKQDLLVAGGNINIVGNTISSSGGGGTAIDSTSELSCNTITTVGDVTVGGIITAPNQISFRASRTAAITITADIILPFDVIVTNIGNAYDNSTYRFTAPVTGTYYLYVQYFTNDNNIYTVDMLKLSGSSETLLIRMERNETQAGGNRVINTSMCAFLNSGDQVYVKKKRHHSVLLPRDPFCLFGGCLL